MGGSRTRLRRGRCLAIAAAALLAPAPLLAQSADDPAGVPPAGQPASEADSATRIVVTGTLIARNARSLAPIEVIDAESLAQQGSPSMMDLARHLPSSAGVIGDSSQFDPRSQFNQGSASVNLRGLGPQRTLVLLNGKRLVASGAGSVPLVDINLVPQSALARIEILKDGAAATYGSDAIAGVVNFITRTDQHGLSASADYRYVDGSDGDWTGALSWGGEVGRVRLFLSAGYQHRSELRVTDRGFTNRPYPENPQGGWSGGGNPGNFDFNGPAGGIALKADLGCDALGGFRSLPGSSADLCYGSYLGFTNLVEPEDRFQLLGDLAADLGPRTQLRVTALFGHTDTVLDTSPSFLPTIAPSGQAAFGGAGMFVVPAYAPALADYCARYGGSASGGAGCSTDAAGVPQAAAVSFPVRFRPFLAGGNPLFDNDRGTATLDRYSESAQLTAELRHDLGGGFSLAAGVTWSSYYRWFQVGDAFVDLLQNALAGFGGSACAYADPAARAGLSTTQLAALAGQSGCSFFNPFSTGVPANRITGAANPDYAGDGGPLGLGTAPGAGLVNDPATIAGFYQVFGRTARTRQAVGDLVLSGGSGIQLPGGEVNLALGGQYRRDSYARTFQGGASLDSYPCPGSVLNPAATCNPQTGALGFIGAGRNVAVAADVWALFAELSLPVTRRISAQLSARYEQYGGGPKGGGIGGTFNPQARVRVELADGIALRGGVGTTFRGPPPQNTSSDQVILTFIGGSFRAVDVFAAPDLAPESATTWNGGLTVDRNGFTASLDYWRYDLKGPIESEPVAGIVSALFGAGGSAHCGDPAYAGLEARFIFSGNVCGAGNVQRLATYAFNSADISTSGIDANASYDWRVGPGVRLQAGASGSYVIEYRVADTQVEGIVVQPAFDAAGLLNYQTTAYPLPQLKGQAWLQALVGEHSLRLQLNHVGAYRDQRADPFVPNNAALAGAVVTRGKKIGAYDTLDAVWSWTLAAQTRLSLALFNVLDARPPFARLDQSFDPFTADALGMTAKFSVRRTF